MTDPAVSSVLCHVLSLLLPFFCRYTRCQRSWIKSRLSKWPRELRCTFESSSRALRKVLKCCKTPTSSFEIEIAANIRIRPAEGSICDVSTSIRRHPKFRSKMATMLAISQAEATHTWRACREPRPWLMSACSRRDVHGR